MQSFIVPKGIAGPPVASRPDMAASGSRTALRLERRLLSACAGIQAEWADLAARAIEPNLFFEPDFLLPAAQHLVDFRDSSVLLAWREAARGERRLVGFLPSLPARRLLGSEDLGITQSRRLGNAAPLLDGDEFGPVVDAVLRTRRNWGGLAYSGMRLPGLNLAGPLALGLRRHVEGAGGTVTAAPGQAPGAHLPGAPELAALRHGLSRFGSLSLSESTSRPEIRDMVEMLLALDASGQRAQLGTAILQDTRETSFLRAVTRNLARTRQCRVGLLMLEGQPIAGAILLGRGRTVWLHVATHDERYASFAPEAQLVAMLRQRYRLRSIVGTTNDSQNVTDPAEAGELHLVAGIGRKPAEIASRAGAALRTRRFRLLRAAAGE